MSRLAGLWTRLHRTLRPGAFDEQMAEEMRAHLEEETASRIALGDDQTTARRGAAIAFGHVESHKEAVRDRRLGRVVETVWRDGTYALRQFRHSPGFAIIVIATIAIGIGASTAVFSLVDAILLRSLPVPNPQELRVVRWSGSEVRMRSINQDFTAKIGARELGESVNHPTFVNLRERAMGLADVFAYFPLQDITIKSANAAFACDGLMVSDNFFSGLGVRALAGRLFAPDDASSQSSIVLTHALWQRQFGGDPAMLGHTVSIVGRDYTIAGVLPAEFPGIRPGVRHEFYVLIAEQSPLLYVPLAQDWHWCFRLMARLSAGATDAQVEAALSSVFRNADPERVKDGSIEVSPGMGGLDFDRELYGRPLIIMLGVTALVMLIACANVAGLALSRGVVRTHELTVRAALGAGRLRLMCQSLAESALLACAGGTLGLLLAFWARGALSRLLAGSADGLDYDLALDRRVLAFGIAGIVATSVLAGLLPALRAGHVDPVDGLRSRGMAASPRLRIGRILVVLQVCVSLSVLAGAGLAVRSLLNLRHIDVGFSTEHLVLFGLNPSSEGYDHAGTVDFHRRIQTALTAIPGVTQATVMDFAPLSERNSSGGFRFADDDLPAGEYRWTKRQSVSASFFATMGVPVVSGRGLGEAGAVDAPKAVVVNEAFVRQLSPQHDPIGRVFSMWSAQWRIVGVCRDAKLSNIKEPTSPTTYFAFPQRFYDRFSISQAVYAVRSTLPPAALRRPIERAVASVNPSVPLTSFTTQTALLAHNIGRERLLAQLGGTLAGVALILCCIGLYGLVAYDVTRRHGEIAVRLAIGAQRSDIAGPILRDAIGLAFIGIALGLPLALLVTRLLETQLYGVAPHDSVTVMAVVATILVVVALAAILPVRRATRIDPLSALRAE